MSDRKIKEAVQQLAGTSLSDEVYIVVCSVESVNEDTRTCDCVAISGKAGVDIPGVQLMAEVDDGFLLIPAVESTVIVAYSKRNVPYITMFSEITKVLIITGDTTIEVKDGSIKLNDGTFGGLIKIEELINKINRLENKVNSFIEKYNIHTHTGVQTGGGISGTTPSTETEIQPVTQKSDLENTLITHGQ